jgi:hypothetical protein
MNLADSGDGSLRQAVLDANAHHGVDHIVFAPGLQGTIALTSGQLNITDDNLTITGPGASQIAVSGSDVSRVVAIATGVTAEIDDLTITHGRAVQGAGVQNAGRLTLARDVVSHNRATPPPFAPGGAVLNLAGGTLTLDHSTLSDNVTAPPVLPNLAFGGGLYNQGTVMMTACTLSGNQATTGGGFFNEDGTITVTDSTFTGNRADGGLGMTGGSGGAFFNSVGSAMRGSTLSVFRSTFTGNVAVGTNALGGAGTNNMSTVTLSYDTFSDNQAAGTEGGFGYGGGIDNANGGRLTITGSIFTDNQALGGNGGVGGPNTFVGQAQGGAINSSGNSAVASITSSIFRGNQAIGGNGGAGGGGSFSQVGEALGGALIMDSVTVSDSTFTHNQAVGGAGNRGGSADRNEIGVAFGGAIFTHGGTVSNSTLTENQAVGGADNVPGTGSTSLSTGLGGAIAASGGQLTVSNSTISYNQAVGGAGSPGHDGGDGRGGGISIGGAVNTPGGTVIVVGSLLAGNQAVGGSGGPGANGGNGLGGGLYNDETAQATLMGSLIVQNQATGGAAGPGGNDGQGVGGGVYIAEGGRACADSDTLITDNHASTSDDDVFGNLCQDSTALEGSVWVEAVTRLFAPPGSAAEGVADLGRR